MRKYKLINVRNNCTGIEGRPCTPLSCRTQKICYYEGIVQDVDNVHELHKQDTTTTFGIHRTVKPSSCSTAKGNDKPKVKVLSEATQLHNYNQVTLQLLQK